MPWPSTSPTGSPLPNMDTDNTSRIPSYTENLTGSGPRRGSARVVDDLHPTAPEASPPLLDRDLHQDLPERAAAWDARLWTSEARLVSLDGARQPVPARTDYRGAVAMEHRPRGLVRADLEHPLQAEGGNPRLSLVICQAAANQTVSGVRVP